MVTQRIKVEGLRELGAAFAKLSDKIQRKVSGRATAAAAAVIKKAAKDKAPVLSGTLKKNIITKRLKKKDTDLTSEHIVTVRRKKEKYANNPRNRRENRAGAAYTSDGTAFYGKFLEFGTVNMSPKPFLRHAFDEKKGAALQAMRERLKEAIDKARQP